MLRRSLILFAMLALCPASIAGAAPGGVVPIEVRMDYEGATRLLNVLQQKTVTESEIDSLLAVQGIAAMVDNTTKYVPSHTRDLFRAAVKEFVTTRKSTIGPVFRLQQIAEHDQQIRQLISEMQRERKLSAEIIKPLNRYWPGIGRVHATIYSVVGGASDGFVVDNDPRPAFYMALNRAGGDVHGVKLNMAHELVHVVQRAARASVPGLDARVFQASSAPAATRLLTLILEEGSATYIAEPMLSRAHGSYVDMWREAYTKNAPQDRIRANFADFDWTVAGLSSATMSWEQASKAMFTGTGSPLYFVGYEMSKALAAALGPRFGRFFREHPAAFFQAYIDLYRRCPSCVRARFSANTERLLENMPRS